MKIIKLLILLFVSLPIFADTHTLNYAEFGIMISNQNSAQRSDQKIVEIGRQWHTKLFEWTAAVGGWGDGGNVQGISSSEYLQALWGVEPRTKNFYIHYLFGPAFITHTDALLGSNFQFAHDVGFGFMDERGVRVGVAFRHYSNAGITKTNEGRNFVVFTAGF